jgi:hypothetical protein
MGNAVAIHTKASTSGAPHPRNAKLISSASIFEVIDECMETISPVTRGLKKSTASFFKTHIESRPLLSQKSMSEKEVVFLIRASLKKMFLFESLEQTYIDKLADCFEPRNCEEGEIIIKQGDVGEHMSVLES